MASLNIKIAINVTEKLISGNLSIPILVYVSPAIPVFKPYNTTNFIDIIVNPIAVPLKSVITSILNNLLDGKVNNFFDQTRNLKTLLNFGEDGQSLLTNWRLDSSGSLLVKLYEPLPDNYDIRQQAWISRELAPTIIDRIFIQNIAAENGFVYLRAPNRNIQINGNDGYHVDNVTLTKLMPTSSAASSSLDQQDPTLLQYYTQVPSGAELNIDYSNYSNFIHFGAAAGRLIAFRNKLSLIEKANQLITSQSVSLSISGSLSGSLVYNSTQILSDTKMELIRSFDNYEKFLYYKINIPYSSSFSGDAEDTVFYNSDCTWPKSGSYVYSTTSSIVNSWMNSQISIADEYDLQNQEYLGNNIPDYILNDVNSSDYVTFINMIGHHFDLIKPYIDQMINMYDRNSDPNQGLSKDLIWNIAQSAGLDLPNKYSVTSLLDYTLGALPSGSSYIYRDVVAETWKRFLHNHIYIAKSKGTKTSIQGLINSYGIVPSLIQIRESSTPSSFYPTASFETYEEVANVLEIDSGAYIQIPWAEMSRSAQTIEVRFQPSLTNHMTLFNPDAFWAVTLMPTTGSYGYINVINTTSNTLASSSAFPLFNGDYYTLMMQYSSSVIFRIASSENSALSTDLTFVESGSTISNTWQDRPYLYLGGSGSWVSPGFTGYIDEFRIWGESITPTVFEQHVLYPGLYNGSSYTSANTDLFVRLSFNQPVDLANVQLIPNESPYIKTTQIGLPTLNSFTASMFSGSHVFPYNMKSIIREVTRFTLDSGGNQYSNNKIIISDPPILKLNGMGLPQLNRFNSIVSLSDKKKQTKGTNNVGIFFSLTQAINDSILRSIGPISIQNLIGDPGDLYSSSYTDLTAISEFFWGNYAYNYDMNTFMLFTDSLLSPFFKQVKDLVPVRSKLLSGIVIEPTLLERSKVALKPLALSDISLSAIIEETLSANVTGSTLPLEAVYSMNVISENIEVGINNLQASLSSSITQQIFASTEMLQAELSYNDSTVIDAEYITIDVPAILIFDYYQQRFSETSLNDNFVMVPISAPDITNDIEVNTYFYQPYGMYPTIQYAPTIVNQNMLRNRGTWASGTSYIKNDYTLAPDNKQYRCTSDSLFISYAAPNLDTSNWSKVGYVNVPFVLIKKATKVNGKVGLVPTSSVGLPFIGYATDHYRFTRDNSTSTKRRNFIGCLQTDFTTVDGKPAIQITLSADTSLFVVNNPGSVQPQNDNTGPILTVK